MAQTRASSRRRCTRRRFMQRAAAAACLPGVICHDGLLRAQTYSPQPVLGGTRIDLKIGTLAFNATGRARTATAVNGSVPAPILRLLEGSTVTIDVTNQLTESTSLHWHGVRVPADQDGVPGLSFRGIAPGQTFSYRFPIAQAGTYWYHSHSGMQEQTGLYGALILVPRRPEPYRYQRDYVVMLTDWTDEDPMTVLSNLKRQSDYYNYWQQTLPQLVHDAKQQGLEATLHERLMWARMRMDPTDILDVSGSTYTFLMNGASAASNWTALFNPGETVRLRFINGSSMTSFDVRIPGLPLHVIAADGSDIEPLTVDELRIAAGETYDLLVEPAGAAAYTIFAQAEDRSGYARGTLAAQPGMSAVVPPMDPRPLRTMADMGMKMSAAAETSGMAGMSGMTGMADMPGMDMAQTPGRRVLRYTDLKALQAESDDGAPARALEFHLTGNMYRFVWGFDGKKFSEAAPIRLQLGERVRFVLINDTMMEHPIHLHGFLFALENGQSPHLPLKHTVNVKPGERLSFLFTADTPGHWAFHCHLLYHMESGMFRTVLIA